MIDGEDAIEKTCNTLIRSLHTLSQSQMEMDFRTTLDRYNSTQTQNVKIEENMSTQAVSYTTMCEISAA